MIPYLVLAESLAEDGEEDRDLTGSYILHFQDAFLGSDIPRLPPSPPRTRHPGQIPPNYSACPQTQEESTWSEHLTVSQAACLSVAPGFKELLLT